MKAIYHVRINGEGIVFEIDGTQKREGYNTKMQNSKWFCRNFPTPAAKKELVALKGLGYEVTRGENI